MKQMPIPANSQPVDLSAQYRAAEKFALLVEQGMLSEAEVIAALIHGARKAGSERDLTSLEHEFFWSLAAAKEDWSHWRALCRSAIRVADSCTMAEAEEINQEFGGPLLGCEVRSCVRNSA